MGKLGYVQRLRNRRIAALARDRVEAQFAEKHAAALQRMRAERQALVPTLTALAQTDFAALHRQFFAHHAAGPDFPLEAWHAFDQTCLRARRYPWSGRERLAQAEQCWQTHLADLDLVVVENVGNLVCPAEFDIGEHAKIAVLSVTEGEDKPSKYPLLFQECRLVLLTKIDLLPHLDYDLAACRDHVARVNGRVPMLEVSTRSGVGFEPWLAFLRAIIEQARTPAAV